MEKNRDKNLAKAACRTRGGRGVGRGVGGAAAAPASARAGGRGLRAWRRGRGRPAAPAVAKGWSCPWRRHRPWALRPAAPYRALAEWPCGAGALPPAGGGRTGRRDRPGRGGRCFSFTFPPREAGALAGSEHWRPRGRYRAGLRAAQGPGTRAAPAPPTRVFAGSRGGICRHLPRWVRSGTGTVPRGRGRWPVLGGFGGAASRRGRWGRRAPGHGEAARPPQRSAGRA